MKISPQLRLTGGLVALLFSVALIGDTLGLLPRSEDQVRDARRVLSESLAVQLSRSAATGDNKSISETLRTLVLRNDQVVYGELVRESGESLARFGQARGDTDALLNMSTLDNLIVPIFEGQEAWGSVRIQFEPTRDWGLKYLGIPLSSLSYILFLCLSSLGVFYIFLRKALKELNPSKAVPERVHSAFEVLAEGVLILDEGGRVVLANNSFVERVDESAELIVGKSPNEYEWELNGKSVDTLPWQVVLRTGESVMGVNLKLRKENERVTFTVNAAPILDQSSNPRGVLITFDDVSTLEAKNTELAHMLIELNKTQKVIEVKNQELQTLATRDALTGVLNRRYFLELAEERFKKAVATGGDMAMLMVDIDHFKKVNDNFGHLVGDQAIIVVCNALGEFFRKGDSVGRYGGEEFVVSLPGSTVEEAMSAADRLRRHVATLVDSHNLPMATLTVSIGLAMLDSETTELTEVLDRADRGLYKAKETGRNQVCLFDPDYVSKPKVESEPAIAASDLVDDDLRDHLKRMKKQVREQADEIAYRSMYDELTRLPNRFLLNDRISQAVKQSERSQKPGAVVSISMSGYQKIFDIEGYDAAEDLLFSAAKVIQDVLRSGDTVGTVSGDQSLTCSRIAHNELALLAVNLEDAALATRVVERVTTALERAIDVGAHKVVNRVYCGVAIFPDDSHHPDSLIRNATLARKFAERRSTHSSGSAFFSPEIDALAVKSARISADLANAVANNGLSLVYQPKVDSGTHEVVGVEALARWEHPELGSISPVDFIEVAEHLGIINEVTSWVMSRVCKDLSAGLLGNVRVSVNVSPMELSDPLTAKRLLGIMADHMISPTQIEIEVTESSFIKDSVLCHDILMTLNEAGVLISLDDFGTGFSSLNMLTQIPIDVIKIDRSFIFDLHQLPAKHCIVQAILLMARSLNMRVVAEGVSCEEEYACLKLLGCTEMQGFFFAKPMPAEQLRVYVDKVGIRPRLTDWSHQISAV
ncbi:MAG: EAL domain-containing protein [Gammaproteobacteria bacterium]